MPHITSACCQGPRCIFENKLNYLFKLDLGSSSPQNLIFHSWPRKVRFWLIKVVDNGTLTNTLPRSHVFSIDCDPPLTLWNPHLRNKCNRRLAISHVLRWDSDRMALNSSSERVGRLPLLFSQPIYREMWGSYLHFASLEAEKNINMLLILNNLIWGVLLPRIRKCAFLLTRVLPLFFHTSSFFFFFYFFPNG